MIEASGRYVNAISNNHCTYSHATFNAIRAFHTDWTVLVSHSFNLQVKCRIKSLILSIPSTFAWHQTANNEKYFYLQFIHICKYAECMNMSTYCMENMERVKMYE